MILKKLPIPQNSPIQNLLVFRYSCLRPTLPTFRSPHAPMPEATIIKPKDVQKTAR